MSLIASCRFAPHSETPSLAVRHAADVAETDGVWRESYSGNCWLAGGRDATVQVDHDTEDIGQVIVLAAHGSWWYADFLVETEDPKVLEQVRPGAGVSLGARSLDRDDDIDLRLRRHTLGQLQHIAIVPKGGIPKIPGAKIMSVREVAARSSQPRASSDWRRSIPPGWEGLLENYEPWLGMELLGRNDRVEYRFDGETFVALR